MTVRDIISRVRTLVKANSRDAIISDRLIWSIVSKHTDSVIFKYRHSSNIVSSPDLFLTVYGIDVEETSLLSIGCVDVDECLDIKIYKTKDKLPDIRVINDKLLIQSVTSVDYSYSFSQIKFGQYTHILNNRYRKILKDKYYAYEQGYIYIFDINNKQEGIGKINVTAAFKDSVSAGLLNCKCDGEHSCLPAQDIIAGIPSSLLSEIEAMTLQEIMAMGQLQIVTDDSDNKHPLNSN